MKMKLKVVAAYKYFLMIVICSVISCSKNNSPATTPNNGKSNVTDPTATVTSPSTFFIASQDYEVSTFGSYWTQEFTVVNSTAFVFRFAAKYQAQAAIITPDQLSNFQSNQSFSGYALFDNSFGTNSITLTPGTYYVAIRNTTNGENKWSTELDYTITLPTSDKATFYDNYVSGSKSFSSASSFYQSFTIQTGFRYFLDGCSVNCNFQIIPADSFSAFQNGQTYNYYPDYADDTGAAPGLWEIRLPAGNYYMISTNTDVAAITYTMERWQVK